MNRSALRARPRSGRLTIAFLLSVISLLGVTAGASAAPTQYNGLTFYTTADLCTLTVAPKTDAKQIGATHAVTATVTSPGMPQDVESPPQIGESATVGHVFAGCFLGIIPALEGVDVKFTVTSGPHAGVTGIAALDATGKATFSYVGTLAGTDTIEAALELPDLCDYVGSVSESSVREGSPLPPACDWRWYDGVDSGLSVAQHCGVNLPAAVVEPEQCPTVTLKDAATVAWTAPPVVVTAAPSVTISSIKRCVAKRFKITPSYANGTVTASTLFVDGKKVKTKNGTGTFVLNANKYRVGRHHIELVTNFADGRSASKTGSFSRCKVRTAARHVSPRFTG